jgi:DNA-binding transcriptional ArsR family regulator
MQKGQDIGHGSAIVQKNTRSGSSHIEDFVLEKSIFNNVFEKDIRRVFIYKKAERLAKAIHLVTPAFLGSMSLKNRLDAIATGLIDAAVLPSGVARSKLSVELLTLSSVLSIARTSGILSAMNTELIARETHTLLQEVAAYEEPRLSLEESPTLSGIAKKAVSYTATQSAKAEPHLLAGKQGGGDKGHIKDIRDTTMESVKDRRDTIMSVIKNKGVASIKDISTVILGVSEKTIQRELLSLVESGLVIKKGERRWSTYSLA